MATKRPNFLIIVADDLGYSDLGSYGGEIRTPNLDQLAADGARFTNYYTAAACSPTRAMLLSGTDSHIAGVGVMSEQKGRDPERWNVPGHEGFLNHDVAALSELLQDGGYHTLLSGKWHLGLLPENNPAERGFDRSFALLPGCSNHYGYEPQFGKDYINFFTRIPPLYSEDGKRVEIEPNMNQDPKGFFTSDFYTDNLIKYLDERTSENKEKPFFAYLPFSAPHWPLQCSREDRERYKGMYNDGPDALRLKRLESLQKLGIVDQDITPHEVIAPEAIKRWQDMDAYEQKASSRAMECFAGMVDNMDQNVGKIVRYLKEIGEFENTFIIFQSDNGAEGAAYEALPTMGADLMRVIHTYYNNELDNIGNPDSFVWYGTRWAQASTAPSRMYKYYSTEGGIKVPFIVHYPKFHPNQQGGALVKSFSTVMDICPTILDLAGIQHPAAGTGKGTYRGRTVASMRGRSWVPFMQDNKSLGTMAATFIHGDDGTMGWELFGRGAVRQGPYKLVHVEPFAGGREDGKWQLYHLEKDPGEVEDLSDSMPDKVEELIQIWEEYRQATGVVWGMPIRFVGEEWDGCDDEGIIGGDAITQTQAWMQVRQGETAARKYLP
ncbi:uncharacterized protein PFLUO_LOCUS8429 [Penicillium psychrofluorescens]|uniref:uncharacterized protein n=1 Tax=Penicillium psychrofluorescens TaxID=3158075 RepID=UPI003CCDCE7D